MLFFVRFDVRQADAMSNRDLIEMWDREGDAALESFPRNPPSPRDLETSSDRLVKWPSV